MKLRKEKKIISEQVKATTGVNAKNTHTFHSFKPSALSALKQ